MISWVKVLADAKSSGGAALQFIPRAVMRKSAKKMIRFFNS